MDWIGYGIEISERTFAMSTALRRYKVPNVSKQESLFLTFLNVSHYTRVVDASTLEHNPFVYIDIQSEFLTPRPQGTRGKEANAFQKECREGGRGRCVPTHMITVARRALISDRSVLSHQLQPASINQSSKANRPQLTNPQVQQVLRASS